MCEPTDENDSRGGGWYCCRCNRWRSVERTACPACGMRHRYAEQETLKLTPDETLNRRD